MRKVIGDLALRVMAILFGMVVVLVSVADARSIDEVETQSMAVETEEVMMVSDESSSIEELPVNYYLVYPGMLPDHPLYWMKAVRDRVLEMFTFDPEEKVELYRIYADKRFGAFDVMLNGNKRELALLTLEKSMMYQLRSIDTLESLKNQGKEIGNYGNMVERQGAKYIERLVQLNEIEGVELDDSINRLREQNSRMNGLLGR